MDTEKSIAEIMEKILTSNSENVQRSFYIDKVAQVLYYYI